MNEHSEGCPTPEASLGQLKLADIEHLLLAGVEALERGEGRELTAADWERLRTWIRERHGHRP